MSVDLLSISERKRIFSEISDQENKERKYESFKKHEVYNGRIRPYLIEQLLKEFHKDTVQEMRDITSINLTNKIINELASIYKQQPKRSFVKNNGSEFTENELAQLENLYSFGRINEAFKKANRYYELDQQCAIQIIPKSGTIQARVLAPYHYDVIPSDLDPETAEVYIINVADRGQMNPNTGGSSSFALNNPPTYQGYGIGSKKSDGINQTIADGDDYKKSMKRLVWWSKDYNFITDGHMRIIDPETNMPATEITDEMILNPIQALPFIDVSASKDYEYWVRSGGGVAQFDLEFLGLLTDVFFIHKMQGYSQAIVYSETLPENFKVGPNHILHIPLDPNKEVQPRFEWASPSADMAASMELVENFIRMFLTSKGMDPKSISGKSDATKFSSGLERLLSMIDKFEASKDSLELFKHVEDKAYELMIKWSNAFQGANQSSTVEPLIPQLQLSTITEESYVQVDFASPEIIQTKGEKEDSVIKLMQEGLMSRSEAIQSIRNVDEATAAQVLEKIDREIIMVGKPTDGLNGEGTQA